MAGSLTPLDTRTRSPNAVRLSGVFPGEAPDATDAATGPLTAAAVGACLGPTPARAPVTRAAIVAAAMDLLNEGGLELVSFRRIAARLQVSAPTLYWHVENKRQLMDLMAEEIVRRTRREPLEPGPGEPWWGWLRTHAQQMFDTLIETRDAPRLLAGNRPSPEVLGDEPLLLAAITEILHRPHTAAFEFGLDLIVAGLRARYDR